MTDPAEIAKGLSEAQQVGLLNSSWSQVNTAWLCGAGCVEDVRPRLTNNYGYLNKLGLAVRAALKETPDGK